MKKIRRKKADAIELEECDKAIINVLKKEERKIKLYKVICGMVIVSTFLLFICGILFIKNLSLHFRVTEVISSNFMFKFLMLLFPYAR